MIIDSSHIIYTTCQQFLFHLDHQQIAHTDLSSVVNDILKVTGFSYYDSNGIQE